VKNNGFQRLDYTQSILMLNEDILDYNKQLTVREAEKLVDGDDDYVDFSFLINHFALVRNQFNGMLKSLDHKNWQISNITKLRCAGIEDATI
jgi:hypothetical protein